MIVKATDIKNSFGKYLKKLNEEDIIVIRNGAPVARITRCDDWDSTFRVLETASVYMHGGKKMSYEAFMDMYEKTEERYEYIDGEAFKLHSPKFTHQQVLGNLHVLFRSWFKGKKCAPFLAPFDVTLKKGENYNVVQPDLLVICDTDNRNEKDRYAGIPSLVLEILSDSYSKMDLVKKLDLYMQTGIREYWIVNYMNREVIVYLFNENNITGMRVFARDDIAESFIFEGFRVEMKEIFA